MSNTVYFYFVVMCAYQERLFRLRGVMNEVYICAAHLFLFRRHVIPSESYYFVESTIILSTRSTHTARQLSETTLE